MAGLIRAGNFSIEVWIGGYPVFIVLSYEGNELARFNHHEISDLQYVVNRAVRQAKQTLPAKLRNEV